VVSVVVLVVDDEVHRRAEEALACMRQVWVLVLERKMV